MKSPDSPGRIVYHGVDFSGSKKAARKIWVASWDGLRPARMENGLSHRTLTERIASCAADGRRHAWLVDAPFALPVELLDLHCVEPTWLATVEWLSSFPSPREWRRACRKVSRKEPRRAVDVRFQTPLAPTNLRLFKQTWHCLVDLLKPLAQEGAVRVLPMQAAGAARSRGKDEAEAEEDVDDSSSAPVWVGEGCPSSTLRRLGAPHAGYKGPSEANRSLREEILARLTEGEDGIEVDAECAQEALDDREGDGLDSLVLLTAARRFAEHDPMAILRQDARAAVEGWVYV
ncbi:MAG: hypothetical protein JXA90_13625 [Planctomycetes bacterium]|nr:hypothetical protein [Planctomycetota bacterium]